MPNKFAAIMVGCGAMSAEWLRSAKELGVEIAALVDLNIDMARSRATEGTICWDGLEDIRGERVKIGKQGPVKHGLFYETEAFTAIQEPNPFETRGHLSVMRQFLRDVSDGIPAETRSTDNIQSLAMVLRAIESGISGQKLPIAV